MRIAYDYQAFSQKHGGVSLYYSRLASALDNIGESVRIFTPFYQSSALSQLGDHLVFGRHLDKYPNGSKRLLRAMNEIVAPFPMAVWRPDIVHRTYYSSPVIKVPAKVNIITVYDMIHELLPSSFRKEDTTSKNKRSMIEDADHVICISNKTREDLHSILNISREKTSCIYLGVDQIAPFKEGGDIKKYLGNSSKPYILYVGARTSYKNFDNFLKAFAISNLMHDFNIIVAGGGGFTDRDIQLIDQLKFDSGQITQIECGIQTLNLLYSSASALIYPSLYEGFGLPPLEAMQMGCPVISSNGGSMPEVIGQAAEFFDPHSIEEMSHAMERVVYFPQRVAELRQLGSGVAKKYTWSSCAENTLRTYKKLL